MTMVNSGLKGLNIKICKCSQSVSSQTNLNYFQPLEVVGRGSETQLQVGEIIKFSVLWVKPSLIVGLHLSVAEKTVLME